MNIANQGFPATRADINNALQAIATNNSGTSAPSTTFANQWFYNETSNKLFIRNEANNAFIEVATLDQTNNEWQITTGQISAGDGDGLVFKTDDGTTRITLSDGGDVTFADGTDIITASAGTDNVRIGEGAGDSILSGGNNNVLIGKDAGTAITTGDDNIAIGYNAGLLISTAIQNTIIGSTAGDALTTGGLTAVGYAAGSAVETGIGNVFMGELSGRLITSNNNTAVGSQALTDCTGGHSNACFGHDAGRTVTGSRNTCIGNDAGAQATSIDDCVIIGNGAGSTATMTGHDNILIGASAGSNVTAGRNVIIGKDAGATATDLTTGTDNIIIGFQTRANAGGMTNAIVMGDSVTGQGNNEFTFGNGSTDSNIVFGATSINAPSDERYKEEIASSTAGLSFINDLRPVTFKWKKAKDLPNDHEAYIADGEEGCDDRVMLSKGETNHGFIAQEVKTAIDAHSEIKDGFRMWAEDQRYDADGNLIADGRQRVAPAELIPMLTKAIQELSAKNDALEAQNTTQATQIADLISRVETLEG